MTSGCRALGAALAAGVLACVASTAPGAPPPPSSSSTPERYPTRSGGRTWTLPANPAVDAPDWRAGVPVTAVGPGVFHTDGSTSASTLGQVRMTARSPAGAAWFRNVEITAYFRQTGTVATPGQEPHWVLSVRGERHVGGTVAAGAVNGGAAPPAGTATWPWYAAAPATVNAACLGTAYHAAVYATGRAHLDKEISHTEGYAQTARADATHADVTIPGFAPDQWFGMKLVARNAAGDTQVHLELWVDPGSGEFQKVAETDDSPSRPWAARTATLDGCGAAPYGYATDQILTWSGPWVTFRSDSVTTDFTAFSVREIDPL